MSNSTNQEPKTGPESDRWYQLTLGPSFNSDTSSKYCTLRYEFKPASIDKTKAGSLHRNRDNNRVSVEFHNNQPGRPKVTFEGSSEEYKENDAVLFFDGQRFRLERLHRAVKQLRHLRMPGESASAAAITTAVGEQKLSPGVGAGRPSTLPPPVPVEVERIDVTEPQILGTKVSSRGTKEQPTEPPSFFATPSFQSTKNDDVEEHKDIDIEDLFGAMSPDDGNNDEQKADVGFDINIPHQNDTDDEIADVDVSGDEVDKGPRSAAEALKAQVNAEQSSSSSSSSGSGSSGSGSGSGTSSSSSSDGEGSDEDSGNSM